MKHQNEAPPTSPASATSGESQVRRWVERLGDLLIEFEGDSASTATRQVVAIHSLTSLVKRQKVACIPPAYREALLGTWDDAMANAGVLELVRGYLIAPEKSLYLWGAVGVGKTFAACCIANELLQAGRSVRFQTLSGLLLDLRDTFGREGTSELQVLTPLFDVEFLILDELGDVSLEREPRASGFAASRLLTLLDRRWQDGKPMIMTSNLPLSELVRWSGDERIASRILGMCGAKNVVQLVGRDLRFDPAVPVEEALSLGDTKH